ISMDVAWSQHILPELKKQLGGTVPSDIEQQVRAKFEEWCRAATGFENIAAKLNPNNAPNAKSEERRYANYEHLVTALIHESSTAYKQRAEIESKLAAQVASSDVYKDVLNRMLSQYGALLTEEQKSVGLPGLAADSRYKSVSRLPYAKDILDHPTDPK